MPLEPSEAALRVSRLGRARAWARAAAGALRRCISRERRRSLRPYSRPAPRTCPSPAVGPPSVRASLHARTRICCSSSEWRWRRRRRRRLRRRRLSLGAADGRWQVGAALEIVGWADCEPADPPSGAVQEARGEGAARQILLKGARLAAAAAPAALSRPGPVACGSQTRGEKKGMTAPARVLFCAQGRAPLSAPLQPGLRCRPRRSGAGPRSSHQGCSSFSRRVRGARRRGARRRCVEWCCA